MLARWRTATLKQRPRQHTTDAAPCTPPTTSTRRGKQRISDRSDDDDVESVSSVLSDEQQPTNVRRQNPRTDWRHQTLLQRVVCGKNRLVQRVLVTLKFADASKDMYFIKKQREYDGAVQLLIDTKEVIELYAQSLLEVAAAVRNVAGNASDARGRDNTPSFLDAAETIDDLCYEYMETVRERVIKAIDDRVVALRHVSELLRERANVQIDLDYAKRTLVVAKKKGDVNVIADKKKALQVAQLRRREATQQIAQLLRHYDNKQEKELDNILTEFASITKAFFHDSAVTLRAVEPPQQHRRFSTTRRLTAPLSERDPIGV